jgi:5-methylcytosine-specific restriction endonuclease McrA
MYDFNPFDDGSKKRDSKRSFTKVEKNEIFDRQNGKCAKCHKPLKLAYTHFHHKKAWSENGKTNINNGIALCANCHSEAHHTDRLKKINNKAKKKSSNPLDIELPIVKIPKSKGGFGLF